VAGGLALGVDVGSTSARARLYARDGKALGAGHASFAVRRTAPDRAEHDSDEIWRAVVAAVRGALAEAGVGAEAVGAVGFDATCSLALFDGSGAPVGVAEAGDDDWNVMMWADHRATTEAAEITATRHRVLDFVGGVMSPEMQMPKLLWLKRHLPANWRRFRLALDLADFLVWRATGVATGSACTLTCKWTYLNHETPGWQSDFLAKIGLADAFDRLGLPSQATQIGARAGYLTAAAAHELGLAQGTPVASGMIDAHAGGLGLLAGAPRAEFDRAIALIAGTSNCHMALSAAPRPIPGVWGPYFGAMMPGLWLNEGGQSATGAALDHVLDLHAEGRALGSDRHAKLAAYIATRLAETGGGFASDLLVVPDFRGNRSPLADPHARAAIFGLDADASFDGLAKLYHATAVGIVYGTRHIVDAMNAQGYAIDRLHLTGGHSKGDYLAKLYADATGCEVVRAREPDAVTLGSAIAAAVAGGLHADIATAGAAMCADGARIRPDPAVRRIHKRGYKRFRMAIDARAAIDQA
jgi:FGGY-family pentulose kinase